MPTLIFLYLRLALSSIPKVELFIDIRNDLVIDLCLDDSLQLDSYEVIVRVNVLLEKTPDLEERRY